MSFSLSVNLVPFYAAEGIQNPEYSQFGWEKKKQKEGKHNSRDIFFLH